MSTLWNKVNYRAPIDCLIDTQIRVYDISKANISILRSSGVLTEEEYQYLYNANKMEREIKIGKLQGSNPEVSDILAKGIIEAKRLFFEMNNLNDNDVLEINNDAVYVMGNPIIKTQQVSPLIYFRLVEVYTSFYKVKDIRFYYYASLFPNSEYINPKGLGRGYTFHIPFMLDFLKELFYTAQLEGTQNALSLLSAFYNQYVNRTLDIGYYRNLNPSSRFSIVSFDKYASYQTDIVTAQMKPVIDISYNEKILREFNRLLTDRYFKEYR